MNPRTVLITGSNRGLGLGFLKEFLKLKTPPQTIIATCRDPDKSTELQSIANDNKNVKILKQDILSVSPPALTKFSADVNSLLEGQGLNCLVNNAGIFQDVSDFTLEEMTRFFTVNAFAPVLLCKSLLPQLQKASASQPDAPLSISRAGVLNVSSDAASLTLNKTAVYKGRFGVYRGSKSALNSMMYNSSIEHEADNILFLMIHPGTVLTDMTLEYSKTPVGSQVEWLTQEESARMTLETAARCTGEDNGAYLNWKGEPMPY